MKIEPRRALNRDEQEYAIKTWHYLRLGMVGLVFGLAASIGYEFIRTDPACVQESISAYYYTPVRAFFVAALVGIGVSLFCLKGSTEREDILLNLAGMFAPFVAFVPTGDPNRCSSGPTPVPVSEDDAREAAVRAAADALQANINNNVTALLLVGLGAAVILLVRRGHELLKRPDVVGYGVAAVVWLVLTLWFVWDPDSFAFAEHAHTFTAIAMFTCILIVVWVNAYGHAEAVSSRRNPYTWIGAVMATSAVVTIVAALLFGKGYSVLVIEAIYIALFTIFWLIQTRELLDAGLRPPAQVSGT